MEQNIEQNEQIPVEPKLLKQLARLHYLFTLIKGIVLWILLSGLLYLFAVTHTDSPFYMLVGICYLTFSFHVIGRTIRKLKIYDDLIHEYEMK